MYLHNIFEVWLKSRECHFDIFSTISEQITSLFIIVKFVSVSSRLLKDRKNKKIDQIMDRDLQQQFDHPTLDQVPLRHEINDHRNDYSPSFILTLHETVNTKRIFER